jgi:hypothetical protein
MTSTFRPCRTALLFFFGLVLASSAPAQLSFLVINELDCDTPVISTTVNDDLEFLELFDGGTGNQSLTGYCIVFFNGAGAGLSYFAMDLTGSTDANGFYLVGGAAVVPAPAQTWATGTQGLLQNGADAVGLYFDSAANFPNGTAATATNLVDAIVYGTSDPPANALINVLTPGQPQVDENLNSLSANESVGRCPDGAGGPLVTTGFLNLLPTPGSPNACPTATPFTIAITQSGCGGPVSLNVSGASPNAELFNIISLTCAMPAGSGPLFGLSVGAGSGDPLSQFLLPLGFAPFHVNADSNGNYSLGFPVSACPGFGLFVEAVSIEAVGFTVVNISPTTGCVTLFI